MGSLTASSLSLYWGGVDNRGISGRVWAVSQVGKSGVNKFFNVQRKNVCCKITPVDRADSISNSIIFPATPHLRETARIQEMEEPITTSSKVIVSPDSGNKMSISSLLAAVADDLQALNDNLQAVAETRFASHTIVMRRLLKVKDALSQMVIGHQWGVWKISNSERAQRIRDLILNESWWARVAYVLDFTEPIMTMLRFADTDTPCLGDVYDGMDTMVEKVKHSIQAHESDPTQCEALCIQVQAIINHRWNKMTTPLHLLAYALSPRYYSEEIAGMPGRVAPFADEEVAEGCHKALSRLFPLEEMHEKVREEFGLFASGLKHSPFALKDQNRMRAITWWYMYGQTFKHLQPLAIKVLSQVVGAENPVLMSAAEQIFGAGGKRMRPALVFLVSRATAEMSGLKDVTPKHRRLAEIIEMIHTASLIHDDVLDESNVRRGKQTIHQLYGTRVAVLAGDFMFAQSSWYLANLENIEVIKLISQVIKDFASGEIKQASNLFDCDISLQDYLDKSYYKTASLIAASTKSAAIFSGVSSSICEKMYNYGMNLGIAFQIVDDILDFTQSTEQLGKPSASDLAKGNLTAPVLFSLEKETKLREIIDSEFIEEGSLDVAINLVHQGGGIERSRSLAKQKGEQAIENLQCLPPSTLRSSLEGMVKYVLERID